MVLYKSPTLPSALYPYRPVRKRESRERFFERLQSSLLVSSFMPAGKTTTPAGAKNESHMWTFSFIGHVNCLAYLIGIKRYWFAAYLKSIACTKQSAVRSPAAHGENREKCGALLRIGGNSVINTSCTGLSLSFARLFSLSAHNERGYFIVKLSKREQETMWWWQPTFLTHLALARY